MIGLGADCTNPLFTAPPPAAKQAAKKGRVKLSLEHDDASAPTPVGVMRAVSGKATVSVSDCLACSGCVTSAETVLLSRDASSEFSSFSREGLVVSVSQASLASIGEAIKKSPGQVLASIRSMLEPAIVVHAGRAHDLTLLEIADEFLARLHAECEASPTPEPTLGVSRQRIRRVSASSADEDDTVLGSPSRNDGGPLPLLASECPGVVCFVEKTAPHAIPYLSSSRSAMAAFGSLLKAGKLSNEKVTAKHVSVVPCADKKLEAARRDLIDEDGTLDVDMALTTSELVKSLGGIEAIELQTSDATLASETEEEASATAPDGSGSGGALDFVYRATAARFGCFSSSGATLTKPLELRRVRNDDLGVVDLDLPDGRKLSFARAYGFRNVQRILSSLKRGECAYHFVEIMACPVSSRLAFFLLLLHTLCMCAVWMCQWWRTASSRN